VHQNIKLLIFGVLNFITKHKFLIGYGVALAALLVLLKWLEVSFIIINYTFEVYVAALAIIFTVLGGWLSLKLTQPKVKTVVVEKEVYVTPAEDFVLNTAELEKTGISKRELEVLQLMAEGLSNQEIAERLHVSLHTVKSHSSKLFEKLEVERRTQAVDKAKKLVIIP
jgi:two-component system, NarL family, response regulator LiaR